MTDLHSLAHDIYSLISKHDLDGFMDLVAEDMIEHEDLPVPRGARRQGGSSRSVPVHVRRVPRLRDDDEDTIVEGDKVVTRVQATGTHQGEFMGIPATGRRIDVPLIDIARIRDGKIAEHWGVMDNAAMMQQLGVAPS